MRTSIYAPFYFISFFLELLQPPCLCYNCDSSHSTQAQSQSSTPSHSNILESPFPQVSSLLLQLEVPFLSSLPGDKGLIDVVDRERAGILEPKCKAQQSEKMRTSHQCSDQGCFTSTASLLACNMKSKDAAQCDGS